MQPIFVGKEEVLQMIPVSSRTIDRMEAAGQFPKRVQIGGRRVGWKYDAVIAWFKALEPEPGSSRES